MSAQPFNIHGQYRCHYRRQSLPAADLSAGATADVSRTSFEELIQRNERRSEQHLAVRYVLSG
jgi:hypothetical protein